MNIRKEPDLISSGFFYFFYFMGKHFRGFDYAYVRQRSLCTDVGIVPPLI